MEKKDKKPDRREYTIMVVPHHGQKIRSIRIPIKAVKYTVSIASILIIVLIGMFIDYRYKLHVASSKIDQLEIVHQQSTAQVTQQVGQIEELSKTAAALQADMERLNALDAEIRRILANEDTPQPSRAGLVRVSAGGRGGGQLPEDLAGISRIAEELQASIGAREQSLQSLKEELLARRARVDTTPSIWPVGGEVTSRFGWRSSPWGGGGGDWHPGIDIACGTGTPVVAAAAGQVVISEWYGGYGNLVEIDHGNGVSTLYGHNSSNAVRNGQAVKKGELIAYAGSTGYSTGPHVHYEVRVNGTAVNPESFLK